jgi:hypothetical protein
MLSTSAEYQTKINSPIRKLFSKVVINYTDPLLDPTITGSSADNNYISYPNQMVNGRTIMTHKWGELDGQFILDGSFKLCASTEESANFNEHGWWSASRADGSGVIDATGQVDYSSRKVSGAFVAFDSKLIEYGVDYTIKFYDGVSLIHTVTETGNALTEVQYTFTQISDIDKVVLNITKWSEPNTVVKVAEFTTQVIEEYTDEILCNWSVIEEREISNDGFIPTGAISSSQATVCLSNANGRPFDANNITSRLNGLVKPNALVEIYLGVDTASGIEYQPMFTGWTTEWDVPEKSVEATTTARDRLNLLTQTNITTDVIKGDTFSDWFETVLNDAGLANTEYDIDTDLNGSDYIVPVGWMQGESHRRALELLAEGCNATVYVGRDKLIYVKKLDNFSGSSVQTFTRDDYSDKDNQPAYGNVVNNITVITSPVVENVNEVVYETGSTDPEDIEAGANTTLSSGYTVGTFSMVLVSASGFATSDSIIVGSAKYRINTIITNTITVSLLSGTDATLPSGTAVTKVQSYTITFNTAPVEIQNAYPSSDIEVFPPSPGVTVTGYAPYSWGSVVEVTNANGTPETFELKATGSTFTVAGQKAVNRTDTTSIEENGVVAFRYPENRFLQNKVLAEDIADDSLASFKDAQRDLNLSFDVGGNPVIELGDTITVTDLYTSKEYKVISQDISYNGGSGVTLKGRV